MVVAAVTCTRELRIYAGDFAGTSPFDYIVRARSPNKYWRSIELCPEEGFGLVISSVRDGASATSEDVDGRGETIG